MAKRPLHHPPLPDLTARPMTDNPGYLMGHHGVCGFGAPGFYVTSIPPRQAVEIIRAHHYSGTVVQNSYVHLGIFIDGDLVGAMQLGYALNPRQTGKIVRDTPIDGYLELNRMWLDDVAPRNSESRALSYMTKYIRRACPGVAWIQSFADERCGGLGVVYQAANFIYLGSHMTEFYELDGKPYHSMLLTAHAKAGQRGAYLKANLTRASKHRLRQFRYIYFLKHEARRRLVMRVQPYPKVNA